VEGIVVLPAGLLAGVSITPASHPVSVISTKNYYAVSTIDVKTLPTFLKPRNVTVTLGNKAYQGVTRSPIWQSKTVYNLIIDIIESTGLIPGMSGKLSL
jgi:hypothetical protein